MPNYWESSTRPLFVKTVFVNGNRHAILSKKESVPVGNTILKKKISRPGSSNSNRSGNSSETMSSTSEKENKSQRRDKNISYDFQNCFVYFKFNNQEKEEITVSEDFSEDDKKRQSKYRKKRCNRGKKKSYEINNEEPMKKNKGTGYKNMHNNCNNINDSEHLKLRKIHNSEKINSYLSNYILKSEVANLSSNENNNRNETNDFLQNEKNDTVLSSSFPNLLTTGKNEKILEKLDSGLLPEYSDPYHIFRSEYNIKTNSLSEKVMQWLDMKKKIKQRDIKSLGQLSNQVIPKISQQHECLHTNKKCPVEKTDKQRPDLSKAKLGSLRKKEICEEDILSEVKEDDNVETALSIEKKQESLLEQSREVLSETFKPSEFISRISDDITEDQNPVIYSIPTKFKSDSSLSTFLEDSITTRLNSSYSNSYCATIKKTSIGEKCNVLMHQSKISDLSEENHFNNEDIKIKGIKLFKIKALNVRHKKNMLDYKNEENIENMECKCNKLTDDLNLKRNSMQKYFKQNVKSINNQNITRSNSSENLLSPRQQSKIPWFRDRKGFRPVQKDVTKIQLHIFIPSVSSKVSEHSSEESDSVSDENMSVK